jgi:VWFA-related protein
MRPFRLFSAAVIAAALVSSIALMVPKAPAQDSPTQEGSATVAKPRKPANPDADTTTPPSDDDQTPIPSKLSPKNKPGTPDDSPTFKVDTNLVSIDVSVLDNRGHFIPNIPRGNFRILEDDVPQQIKTFATGEAPMTVTLLVEFSNKYTQMYSQNWFETLQAAYGFVSILKPEDYLAVIAYDMKPEIMSDFSQDRMKAQQALSRLRIPGFSEACLFDALADTEERMKDIEGRKAIVLLSTGQDTFSKLTFDKARKVIQNDAIPVYTIGLLQRERIMSNMRGSQEIGFLQGDNELTTFSKETGGMAFFPRFITEYGTIFQSIQQALRNQYSIGYAPTNLARDGKFRKIKVQLVNPQGDPLKVSDEKGKPIKYQIVAKAGYTAPRVVE